MEWNGMERSRTEWSGWKGMERIGTDWIGAERLERTGRDGKGVDWNGMERLERLARFGAFGPEPKDPRELRYGPWWFDEFQGLGLRAWSDFFDLKRCLEKGSLFYRLAELARDPLFDPGDLGHLFRGVVDLVPLDRDAFQQVVMILDELLRPICRVADGLQWGEEQFRVPYPKEFFLVQNRQTREVTGWWLKKEGGA